MEMLSGKSRHKSAAHDSRRKRREGVIPGILYGKNIENTLFEIGELELNKEVTKNGQYGTLNIEIDGQKHKTLIKEVQRDPVKEKILHIDLEEINDDTVISTDIPVVFTGEDMIMRKGGCVQKERDSLKIKCKSQDIPKSVNVDLAEMQIGDTYKIADVEFSNEIIVTEDVNSVIATISPNNKGEEEIEASEKNEIQDVIQERNEQASLKEESK